MIRKRPHAAMGGVARATGGEQQECTTPGTKPGKKGHRGSRVWQRSKLETYDGWRDVSDSLQLSPDIHPI